MGYEVTYLSVDEDGNVDLEELRDSFSQKTVLITCILANNETGVISPVKEIGNIAREKGVLFHTDAVQALGKIKLDIGELPVDAASFSSHKIYGPKGVGAVYLKTGLNPVSLLHGGGQEKGKRSGTENVPGVAGFGKACELIAGSFDEESNRVNKLTRTLEARVLENSNEPGPRRNCRFNGLCLFRRERGAVPRTSGNGIIKGDGCIFAQVEPGPLFDRRRYKEIHICPSPDSRKNQKYKDLNFSLTMGIRGLTLTLYFREYPS